MQGWNTSFQSSSSSSLPLPLSDSLVDMMPPLPLWLGRGGGGGRAARAGAGGGGLFARLDLRRWRSRFRALTVVSSSSITSSFSFSPPSPAAFLSFFLSFFFSFFLSFFFFLSLCFFFSFFRFLDFFPPSPPSVSLPSSSEGAFRFLDLTEHATRPPAVGPGDVAAALSHRVFLPFVMSLIRTFSTGACGCRTTVRNWYPFPTSVFSHCFLLSTTPSPLPGCTMEALKGKTRTIEGERDNLIRQLRSYFAQAKETADYTRHC
jgi:hypothetical protein